MRKLSSDLVWCERQVYVSGTQVVRPRGQVKRDDASVHIPTNSLDFEMELGFFVGGPATAPGQVRVTFAPPWHWSNTHKWCQSLAHRAR